MQLINKIKTFYIVVFSYIGRKLKELIAWNKTKIQYIKSDLETGNYIKVFVKSIIFLLLVLAQVSLGLVLIISYIACKLTGICLII